MNRITVAKTMEDVWRQRGTGRKAEAERCEMACRGAEGFCHKFVHCRYTNKYRSSQRVNELDCAIRDEPIDQHYCLITEEGNKKTINEAIGMEQRARAACRIYAVHTDARNDCCYLVHEIGLAAGNSFQSARDSRRKLNGDLITEGG